MHPRDFLCKDKVRRIYVVVGTDGSILFLELVKVVQHGSNRVFHIVINQEKR